MNLSDYIKEQGEDAAAAKFRVSIWTIRSWRQRAKFPRTEKANEIVSLTGGIVTLADIYAPVAPKTEAA